MQFDWSQLTRLQLGRYAEYYAKMELTRAGFDVYTAEVHDKGMDFVVRRKAASYYDIQVKSIRGPQYIYLRKEVFRPRENLLLVLVIFSAREKPSICLIPSLDWINKAQRYLVDYYYEGKKSKPEYGIRVSVRNLPLISQHYAFRRRIADLGR